MTSGPLESCFVCDGPTTRADVEHFMARFACPTCKGRARLAATDVPLHTLLESTRPEPLEGSGLNPILNPCVIDGRRAWADYAAGGVALLEEVVPSSDWFDFVVQHATPLRHVVAILRERQVPPGVTFAEMFDVVRDLEDSEGRTFVEALERCRVYWLMSVAASVALDAAGPIRSNGDAWAVIDALPSLNAQPLDATLDAMATHLTNLAAIRG